MWKKILNLDCWVENDKIIRVISGGKTCYVYKHNKRTGGFDKVEPKVSTFRRGDYIIA